MISIIIPTYNRARFLPRTIKSVLNQTYQDWELIVSDDGSTDNTENVVSDFLKDSRIKYVKNINAGATAARNAGAKLATGEYLTFLDSDDWAELNWLESFCNNLTENVDVVCCGYRYIDVNGNVGDINLPKKLGVLYGNKIGRFTNGGVFMLRRKLFEQINGYDEHVRSGQHSELAIRLIQKFPNLNIKNLNRVLINVYEHKGFKIRSDDRAILDGSLYVTNKHIHLFKLNPEVYANYCSVAAVSAMRLKKYKEGRFLFFKAWLINKSAHKHFFRYCISTLSFFGMNYWKLK